MPLEIILQRISSFTPEYQDFIFSDFTEEAVKSVQLSGFTGFEKVVLENGIFMYLTLFLHKFTLTEFIILECQQSIPDAKLITAIIMKMMPTEMTEEQTTTAVSLEVTDELVKEKDRFAVIYNSEIKLDQYLYIKTGDFVTTLSQKYLGEDGEKSEQFKSVISDIVLGFYKKEDTVALLQQELGIDPKNIALLGTEVLELFETITNPAWLPPTTPNQVLPTNQTYHSAILPEIRTMAADMAEGRSPVRSTFNAAATLSDEPMYSSTQPIIERPVTEAPSYAAPLYQEPKPNVDAPLEKPRWG